MNLGSERHVYMHLLQERMVWSKLGELTHITGVGGRVYHRTLLLFNIKHPASLLWTPSVPKIESQEFFLCSFKNHFLAKARYCLLTPYLFYFFGGIKPVWLVLSIMLQNVRFFRG